METANKMAGPAPALFLRGRFLSSSQPAVAAFPLRSPQRLRAGSQPSPLPSTGAREWLEQGFA